MKNLNKREKDIYSILSILIFVGAFVVITMIAMLSEYGKHPDEYDVKACLDWAMSHWIWPDMRLQGTGLGDTYSWYGYTKVCNYTIYFLVMSKIAFIFKLFMGIWPYYRVPNILLALFMAVVCARNIRDKKYLLLGFGVCVQSWYIFSYVTADALDFVFSFLAIYLLADKNSMLWKLLQKDDKEKTDLGYCILLGVLYGMILLGKPYYYSLLVLTFVVLLINMINTAKEKRAGLWRKYIIILLSCLLIYGARAGLDFYYYGTHKAEIKKEMMDIYASDDKKPSTPVEEQLQTFHAYEKGYPLSFIFEDDPDWFVHSYRSFVSSCITTEGNDWYFLLMGALYICIYAYLGIYMLKKNEYRQKENRIVFICATLLIIGGVIASVLNSYFIDSQPQGRYLLPVTLITCFLGAQVPEVWKKKSFRTIVLIAACLSIMYFGLFDSRELIDLSYAKGLIAGN